MSRSKLASVVLPLAMFVFAARILGQATADHQSRAAAGAAAKSASSAQAASPWGAQSADIKSGTKVSAELASTLDARTAKRGDEVQARVTKNVKQDGRVVIHKGDKLIGHVTEAQAGATADASSRLAVTFDHLVSAGTSSQLNAVVTSIFTSQSQASGAREPMMSEPMPAMGAPSSGGASGSAGGGLVGGLGSTTSSTLGAGGSVAGSAASNVNGIAGAAARGTTDAAGAIGASGSAGGGLVAPLSAVHVRSEVGAQHETGMNSVLSSKHGDVRLDSGTRLEFRVASRADVGAGTK